MIGPGFRQKDGGKKIEEENEKEDEDDLGIGVIPPAGRNVATTSVKPSDFAGQGRNISRNIFGVGRNNFKV